MAKIKIVKSGRNKDKFWSLCKNENGGYAILPTVKLQTNGEIEIEETSNLKILWLPFSSTEDLDLKKGKSLSGWNRNSKFNFGMYNGYEVGIVYSFDPDYIDWCINTIPEFYIDDLEILEQFGILSRKESGYQAFRHHGVAEFIYLIDSFNSIQDIATSIGMAFTTYKLEDTTRQINFEKKRNHR